MQHLEVRKESPSGKDYWRFERAKKERRVRALVTEYRVLFGQWAEDEWGNTALRRMPRRRRKREIFEELELARREWRVCVERLCGRGEVMREESRWAREMGGLLHAVVLGERLVSLQRHIEAGGEGWVEWNPVEKSRYFKWEEEVREDAGNRS